ncbi:MAG: TM2 domain-containing protein [Bacilli bacterium]
MDREKVDMYLMANQKYFPAETIGFLRERLLNSEDHKLSLLMSVELKDPTTILLLSLFLGSWGVDRFMLGDTGMGVLKLLTGGLCGVLTIYDWFTCVGKTKKFNYDRFMAIL